MIREQCRPELTALDDENLRPEPANDAGGPDEIGFTGQLAGLGVIDDEQVDVGERCEEPVARAFDPEIHRVERHKPCRGLQSRLTLELWIGVGEKQERNFASRVIELRIELRQHVELRIERVRRVQVVSVFSFPEEGLAARHSLEVSHVDPAVEKDLFGL